MEEFLDLKVMFEENHCEECDYCNDKECGKCEETIYNCVLEDTYYLKFNSSNWINEMYHAYVTIAHDVDESYYLQDGMTVRQFLEENKNIKSFSIDNEVDEHELELKDLVSFYRMDEVSELLSRKNSKLNRNQLAEIIAEDGQPVRALYNYLGEAFELLDGFESERSHSISFKDGLNEPILDGEEINKWSFEDYVNALMEVCSSMNDDLNDKDV